jgi:hypothetical protein
MPSTAQAQEEQQPHDCWDRLVQKLHLDQNPSIIIKYCQEYCGIQIQGRLKWTVLCLSWLAFLLGIMSVTGCTYMEMGGGTAAGIFREPIYDDDDDSTKILGCVRYADSRQVDRGFKIVRAMSVLMLICMTAIVLLITPTVLFMTNHAKRISFYSLCRILVSPTLIFHCIMFILFGREECASAEMQCSPGFSGKIAIINTFVIFILAILLFVTPVPTHPEIVPFADAEPTPPSRPAISSNSKTTDEVDQPQHTKDIENAKVTSDAGSPVSVVIPELGKTYKEVDFRIRREREKGRLKVSQRLIHVDGTKIVTSYFVKETIKKESNVTTSKKRGNF